VKVLLAALLLSTVAPADGAEQWRGYAVRHGSLARVAAERGMSTRGVLFASPLVPLGTRLCVRSEQAPKPICGVVVDVPQPRHKAWQLRERRYLEVTPALAWRLCEDPTGLPRDCPVTITRG
jgi:hypothetical protein